MWNDWKTKYLLIADLHAPRITRKVRSEYAPWITDTIKKSIYHRDFLKRKAVKTGSKYMHEAYKREKNRVNKLIKHTKANYYIGELNKHNNNLKEMWNTVNKLINKNSKTTNITELKINDETISKPQDIAEAFNTFFCEVGRNLAKNLPNSNISPESYIRQKESKFELQLISVEQVYKLLSTNKVSKAAGHDKISHKLLQDAADVIAHSLTAIFNLSIETGVFPEDLKTAVVSPIYKTGDKSECTNYRPISVLFAVAKTFERLIISDQFYKYLETNNILSQQQAGFRKNYSTQTSLLNITNKWLISMDKGYLNGVVFLDLKKAFDCVDHKILVKKLLLYGCTDRTLKWFGSYLNDRSQMSKIDQCLYPPKKRFNVAYRRVPLSGRYFS